jgi:hypothetical protein
MSARPAVQPYEIDNPENEAAKILVFMVAAGQKAYTYRDGEKTSYYVRRRRLSPACF